MVKIYREAHIMSIVLQSLDEQVRELKIIEIEQRIANFESILKDMKYDLIELKDKSKITKADLQMNRFNNALDNMFSRNLA